MFGRSHHIIVGGHDEKEPGVLEAIAENENDEREGTCSS